MNRNLFFIFFFLLVSLSQAQVENNTNSVQFQVEDKDTPSSSGLELPARKLPSLSIPVEERNPNNNRSLGEGETPALDITKTDGLLDNKTNNAPKAFTKDKEPTEEFNRDMNFGNIKTGAKFVSVQYRDHEYVDGDLIRVYVNGDIVQSSIYLDSSFSGFTLTLEKGINKIEFEALNQGSSGPNTAELHVYDDKGLIVSAKEWNLLTGRRAIITVIKE
ncbi:MAG: hypothetical protein KDC91_08870 [Flavobacteriaceae bacterium]|nr:hypothetical protein [Flavobacteriaceae bacterium]